MSNNYDVVLVDDDRKFLNTLKFNLEDDHISVLAFQDPALAIEFFKQGEAKVIITDFKMPVINGLELIRRVKEIDNEIKIVLMTEFWEECRNEFPDVVCFNKPFNYDEILGLIKSFLD